jgi:hypothetical protein
VIQARSLGNSFHNRLLTEGSISWRNTRTSVVQVLAALRDLTTLASAWNIRFTADLPILRFCAVGP